jgi:hypothetical protein
MITQSFKHICSLGNMVVPWGILGMFLPHANHVHGEQGVKLPREQPCFLGTNVSETLCD